MLLNNPGPVDQDRLEWTEIPEPSPQDNEILLRVLYCGICHTDLHTVEGDLELIKQPVIPGHQVIGEVVARGKTVSQYRKGDRVGTTWLYSACQSCAFCRQGKENLCDQARFTGLHADGGYAEYMVIPADFVVKIPDGFAEIQAAPLLCAGVIGYRSLKLCEIQPGQKLGLYGFGASAHIAIQIARYWDCEVYVFTRSQEHRQHALKLGARWTGTHEERPAVAMDSSILFAPVGTLVPQALRHLKKGGTLAINAVHLTPIPELTYDLLYFERTLRSVANCTRQDALKLMELAQKIPLQTDCEVYPLSEANQVLRRLKKSEIYGAAVLQISY